MVSANNVTYSEQICNLFCRNSPTLCFWLRGEGRQMLNAEQLLYQTGKSSHQSFPMKTLFLNILQYSRENTCVKLLRTPILKNICIWLLLDWLFEVIVWKFASGSHLKPSWLSNITKILNFQTKALNKILFHMFIINGYYTKNERL